MKEYYEQPLPIRTYDIDFAGIVSNIVFIRWLEDLRLALLDQAYPLVRALAEDVAPILLATRINYRRPVTIADPLVGRIRVVRQQDRQPAGTTHRVAVVLADRVPRKFRIAAGRLVIEGEADNRLCHVAGPSKPERR